MTEPPSTPPGATADSLFASYRERLRAGAAPPRDEFLAAQPPELRAELARLFADFDALAGGAAGAATPAAGTVLDDFRLVRELGEGGMGTVWLAEQLSLKRSVALKLLHPQFGRSPLVLDRFRREAEAGARLTHPGIVQVHAVGASGGVHFLAQEFVPGGSLADSIAQQRERRGASPVDHRATAELFRQIALALEHAHCHGVIHRDLKPANILLTAGGEPKVADFGLAKLDDEFGLSRTGDFAGTPFYMSPEQAAARRMGLDLRTDVFSFGATLYEALTLVRAFDGDTSQQVIHKILTEDPLDPRRIRSQVPRGLAVICMKCLEKNPDRRYPTMAAAAEDLRRWLAHEPLRARPPGPIARLRKWSRRHPVLAMGIATGSVALAVVTRLLMEVRDERDGAEAATSAARREARTAEETIDFLIGLFDESDPARTPGVELTAREILQRGAARVQAELREEPAVRARLLGAIGQVAWTLGDYGQAEPLLREALAESRRLHGDGHPETLASLGRLGLLCLDQDRLTEAEELLAAALAGGLAAAEPDRGAILTQRSNLAVCLQAQRRFPEAETLLLAVLEGDRALYGSDHPLTLTALNNLADLYRVWGRLDEAEPWMREALARSERVRGADDPSTLSTRDGLGVLLLLQGRSAEAEPLIEEALAGLQRVLPESHPDRLTATYHLGLLRERQGRLEEATELWRAVYEGDERTFGPDHDYTLQAMQRLARNLQARGLAGEAVELVRELVRRTPADAGDLAGRQGLLREVETAAAAAGEPSRPGGGER